MYNHYCISYFIFQHTSFLYENTHDCYIVTISHKLIIDVTCTVYRITARLPYRKLIKTKMHKAAIAKSSVCNVGDELLSHPFTGIHRTHSYLVMLWEHHERDDTKKKLLLLCHVIIRGSQETFSTFHRCLTWCNQVFNAEIIVMFFLKFSMLNMSSMRYIIYI